MRHLYTLLISIAFLMSCPLRAGEYSIGVESIEYLPFSNVQNKQYSGFYRDLFDKFSADSGHQFTYRPLPIKRLAADFISGKVDFKLPDSELWGGDFKKGKSIVYSNPITQYTDGIMVRPENKGKLSESFSSISTLRGFTPFPFLKEIEQGKLKVNEANSLGSILKMVEMGRVSGAFVNVTVARHFLEHTLSDQGKLVYDDGLPKGISGVGISTISHGGVINEFNDWMKANDAWVDQLKAKYKVD